MTIPLLILGLGFFNTLSSEGRLIERNTLRTKTTEIKTAKPIPTIRLTRNVFDDSLTGLSKEDDIESEEFISSYNKRVRQFFKYKPSPNLKKTSNAVRVIRDSSENVNEASKKNNNSVDTSQKKKVILVKKPIPKFSDIDYDDDFQTKVVRCPIEFADSGDHEDEDFNLDDYDFDVNHDEYVGRGKHLEPRIRAKEAKDLYGDPVPKVMERKKTKESKILLPAIHQQASIKKERAIEKNSRKEAEMTDDYYDESTTKIAEKEVQSRDVDDETGNENEESKEFGHKEPPVRAVRSWNISSYVDKSSSVISKYFSILPMFPNLPQYRQLNYDDIPMSQEAIIATNLDALNGQPFDF